MGADVALTAAENAALAGASQVYRWLVWDTDNSINVVATARINQTEFIYPLTQFTVDTTSAGWANILPGQIIFIGSTAGSFNKGIFAVRKAGTATTLELTPVGEGDSGEITSSIRTVSFEDNDHITVLNRVDIFGLNPRIDYPGTGDAATIYENWDQAYSNDTRYFAPIVNLIIDGQPGNFGKHIYADSTYTFNIQIEIGLWATSSSATYTITLPSGITLNSGSLTGTEAGGTINVTATQSADPYAIKIVAAENNGKSITCFRKVWIKSNAYPPIPVTRVDSDSYNRDTARMSITINGQELADLPPGAMVHYFEDVKWNATTVASAVTAFTGYVIRRRDIAKEGLTQTTLELSGPCGIMQLIGANSQYFEATDTPATFQQIYTSLSYLDAIIYYFFRLRAFGLLQMFNYQRLGISNSSAQMTTWRIEAGTLYSQVQSLAVRYRGTNVGSDPSGEIFVRSHISVVNYDDRDTTTITRAHLHEYIYQSADLGIEERPRVRRLRGEAFVSDAVTVTPVWCDAPGQVPGQGASEEKLERQVVDSASEIYQITGDEYARRNNRYPNGTIIVKKNYNVIKPAQMYRLLLTIPARLRPDNQIWSGYVLPLSVNRRHNEDGTVDVTITIEAETAGVPAVDVPVPIPDDTTYSPFSRLRIPRTISAGWGKASTNVPLSGNGLGGLWATSDGYVLRGGVGNPTNISPTSTQRNSIGTSIKMIADPWNYRRLILYGSAGALVCDDHAVISPVWRKITINAPGTITQQIVNLTYPGTYGAPATGPSSLAVGASGTIVSGDPSPDSGSNTIIEYDQCVKITVLNPVGWSSNDPGEYNAAFTKCAGGADEYFAPTSPPFGTPLTASGGYNRSDVLSSTPPGSFSYTLRIDEIIGGGTITGELFIGDIQGSINRQSYFCWLSKRSVSGTDYVYFNYTADAFRTRKSVQVAKWQSDLYYSIQLRSYNTGTSGVIFVTAGTTADSTAKAYKSTNWGATWAATTTTINTRGGLLGVPYNKGGGSANSSTSPVYGVVKGLSGGNLQFFALDASTNTVVATASYPIHPYAFGGYTLDGNILSLILQDRTFYTTANGGVSWTAKTTPTGGASATAVGCTGSPVNSSFYFAFGYRLLTYSSNGGTSWTSFWSAYDTWRSSNLSGGETIISAFMDLSKTYSKAVTS